MGMQYEFGFTNSTKLPEGIKLTDMKLVEDYGLRQDDADRAVLDNVTAPQDAAEYVTFSCRDIAKVQTNVPVTMPTDAKGVIYGVKVEAVRRGYDDFQGKYISTEPIVCDISIRHQKGDSWEEYAREVLERAFSSLYYVLGSGGESPTVKSRIGKLMRSQERPLEDTTVAG